KLQSLRVNTRDFDTIKTLATGAVGKVCLVRAKKDSKVYAMKILKKQDLLTRQEAAFFMEERNALVFSQNSRWITTLYAAFQDDENLYLVMEYVSGGSLRAMINNRETPMTEAEARFYIAEMIVALEVIHKYNYIHRDIKPENWLIDSTGHVKLADFGSCIRISETARVTSHETVGTPDYISPEILRAHEGSANYGQSVDWWSLGIILYELLFDEVPFYSESLVETYGKIMDHEVYFAFPEDADITPACRDLIQKLICNQDVRLGKNGIEELKSHPWFEGVDWDNIAESKAPFVPELSGPEDTRYFEDEE
ncbi:kinase-like domain-containing protein, partial [Entophlyctis helioformis]